MLEIRDLHLTIDSFDGRAHVLNGVDLTVGRGRIVGLVGESGCGKSLTGLSVSRLVPTPPARYVQGSVRLNGRDVLAMSGRELRAMRGRHVGMIFQDPTTNLNPAFRISEQMVDVALHAASVDPSILGVTTRRQQRKAARALAVSLLEQVGVVDAATRIDHYPHQFSGGMRQRVLIAMALIGRPELLIADEPTTALDVRVQAQILALLYDLVQQRGLSVLLITHNLGVVAQVCDEVAVMYAGNVVERGPVEAVFHAPAHPYTRALLAAVPRVATRRGELRGLAGVVPSLIDPPPGCRFAPRCSLASAQCRSGVLPMVDVGGDAHQAACVRLPGAPQRAA